MKITGIILTVMGVITTLFFGMKALGNSDSFSFLGIDFAVSSANWTPVIISGLVLIVGIVLIKSGKR